MPEARWPRHRHRTISRCFMTWIGRNQGCCYWARVRKRVSGRDLNPYGCDLRLCLREYRARRITTGQARVYVSEGGLEPGNR
jgi:hypothetical protein